jgi:hypothetical protein
MVRSSRFAEKERGLVPLAFQGKNLRLTLKNLIRILHRPKTKQNASIYFIKKTYSCQACMGIECLLQLNMRHPEKQRFIKRTCKTMRRLKLAPLESQHLNDASS